MITISLVSHNHGQLVADVIQALDSFPEVTQIILICNRPEHVTFKKPANLTIINNQVPVGFAANHNTAFQHCREPYFCVLNPDIVLTDNPFPELLNCARQTGAALVAPVVVNPDGDLEDSIRRYPTVSSLCKKLWSGSSADYDIGSAKQPFFPEWVAGMFMLFSRPGFAAVGGFDPRFYLYYEDVDICARLWKNRHKIVVCPEVKVIHAARRESHHDWRFRRWHLLSMARYFCKHTGRLSGPGGSGP